MLFARIVVSASSRCKLYSTASGLLPVHNLQYASVETFRREVFDPAVPALLPRSHFADLPAIRKWFSKHPGTHLLNLETSYLARFGATIVPIEITNDARFARIEQSLSFFLECVAASTSKYRVDARSRYFSAYVPNARAVRRSKRSNDFFSAAALTPPTARVYLAQAPLADLPLALRNDVPTPELVLQAGRGDVYDSSIWLGPAPTYTPLHRDPNPNLFVQLAGTKIVRLFRPHAGNAIFAKVQEKVQGSASATMRGEEMMQGAEREALENAVWGEEFRNAGNCWEATLVGGDGLFIPKGWWHSVKGVGEGMTGSVNWWFR